MFLEYVEKAIESIFSILRSREMTMFKVTGLGYSHILKSFSYAFT